MDDLIAFWTARLDEDEAIAKVAANVAGPEWTWKTGVDDDYDEPTDYVTSKDGTRLLDTLGGVESEAPHVALHDPARALREVEADRKLLAAYQKTLSMPVPESEDEIGERLALEFAVQLRASVYDGHPDYRPEWKP